MYGVNQQGLHAGGRYAAGISPPLTARLASTLNMSWHMRKPEQGDWPIYLKQVKPLGGLLRDRPSPTALNKRRNRWLIAVAVAIIAIGLVYALPYLAQSQAGVCAIKGNISSSGERIYHVPGQRYYDKTLINGLQGERWFCTEQDRCRLAKSEV